MKRQATDWEEILAKDTPDKGLFSKIDKELLKSNIKKTTQCKKWIKNPNRHVTKITQMANKHTKRCSTSCY